MNQAIQFPDCESWDAAQQAVIFPVLVNGMGLTCAITLERLRSRYGTGEAMALFTAHRWDLEDEAEQLIREEEVSDQGWVWLS